MPVTIAIAPGAQAASLAVTETVPGGQSVPAGDYVGMATVRVNY